MAPAPPRRADEPGNGSLLALPRLQPILGRASRARIWRLVRRGCFLPVLVTALVFSPAFRRGGDDGDWRE